MSDQTAHLSLYRRWRSQRFDAIVGQDEIVRTVRNAVISGEVAHAYLFAGERGIGKTSIARILARAVNCLNVQDGEPCNECANCRTILSNRSLDIVEIDGASNRGIDHIRRLREEVNFAPTDLRTKVYIIDEVHMLTNEAFNALLKTLEEPPSHVIFAFATTEPHKVPRTIISRCQAFHLRHIPPAEISGHLARVAEKESINLTEGAVQLIARRANGGMRDALVMLEQAASYEGSEITEAALLDMLGLAGSETHEAFVAAIAANDRQTVLEMVDALAERGKDLEVFLADVIQLLRTRLADSDDDMTIHIARRLLEIKTDLFRTLDRRIRLEIGLLELMRSLGPAPAPRQEPRAATASSSTAPQPQAAVPDDATPQAIESEVLDVIDDAEVASVTDATPAFEAPEPVPSQPSGPTATGPEGFANGWSSMLATVKQERIAIAAYLGEGQAVLADDRLTISFHPEHTFHKESLEKQENFQYLAGAVRRQFGDDVRVEIGFDQAVVPAPLARDLLRQKADLVCEVFDGRIVKEES